MTSIRHFTDSTISATLEPTHSTELKFQLCIKQNSPYPWNGNEDFFTFHGGFYQLEYPHTILDKMMDEPMVPDGDCTCGALRSVDFGGGNADGDYIWKMSLSHFPNMLLNSPYFTVSFNKWGTGGDWGVRIGYDGWYGDVWNTGKAECQIDNQNGATEDMLYTYLNENEDHGTEIVRVTYTVPNITHALHFRACYKSQAAANDSYANRNMSILYQFTDDDGENLGYHATNNLTVGDESDKCYCADSADAFDMTDHESYKFHLHLNIDDYPEQTFDIIYGIAQNGENIAQVIANDPNWYLSTSPCDTQSNEIDFINTDNDTDQVAYLTYHIKFSD